MFNWVYIASLIEVVILVKLKYSEIWSEILYIYLEILVNGILQMIAIDNGLLTVWCLSNP